MTPEASSHGGVQKRQTARMAEPFSKKASRCSTGVLVCAAVLLAVLGDGRPLQLLIREPWRYPMAAQHLAAIEIQRLFRGVLSRRGYILRKVGAAAAGKQRRREAN